MTSRTLGGLLTVLIASSGVVACSTTSDPAATSDAGVAADASAPPPADASPTSTDAAPPPPPPGGCKVAEDCPSKVCDAPSGKCLEPSCSDGARNGDETDVDCGGSSCEKCDIQKACASPGDCASGVCRAYQCRPPACDDAVKNGTETDVDCGGGACGKCVAGKRCLVRADCVTDVCSGGRCSAIVCDDRVKNGTETDVDCGGPGCPRCADAKDCLIAGDCASGACKDVGAGLKCQPPSCTDGVKNGTESDVDCGGSCPACVAGKACTTGTDCASRGCNYKGVCAAGRSCTARYGGDTCGFGGAGSVGPEQWEDCCIKTPLVSAGQTVLFDRYQVTAGRMRVFLEAIGYNVRAFVQQARAANKIPALPGVPGRTVLEPAWDLYLPVSFSGNSVPTELAGCAQRDYSGGCAPGTEITGIYTAVSRHLGGFIFQRNAQTSTGCFVGSPGTHAFRFPDGAQDGPAPGQSQEVYDTKSMQCIDYLVGQAFCVWDGGRLETIPEWQVASGPGPSPWSPGSDAIPRGQGSGTYWGCRFPWVTDANQGGCELPWSPPESIEYAAFQYSYEYPRLSGTDYISFISAPGRTRGRGPGGHADMRANVFELTSTVTYDDDPFEARHRWSGNGSWEGHGYSRGGGGNTMLLNKYGKLGLRCVFPQ